MPPKKALAPVIYQLKVTLQGSKPPIWRRLLVENTVTLPGLHDILQTAMGWYNCHLHAFRVGHVTYSEPHEFDDMYATEDERKYQLGHVLKREKDSLIYEYDFGDGWEHKVVLEKILPVDPALTPPRCIKGKGACPPEDCGGIYGYYEMLDILADPQHPEYEDMLDWVGGEFDAEAFDLDTINQQLAYSA